MAIYRSDQAQLTFSPEAGQGGDMERMRGTLAHGPNGFTLSGDHSAGTRTLTLAQTYIAWKGGTSAGATAILVNEGSGLSATATAMTVDVNHNITKGRVLSIGGSEALYVKNVSTNTLTIVRGYDGTTPATVADNANVLGRFVAGDFIRIGTEDASDVGNTEVNLEVRRVEAVNGTSVVLDRPLGHFHANGQAVLPVSAIDDISPNDRGKYITWIPGVYESVETPDPEMTIEGRRFLGTQSKRNWSYAYAGQQTLTGGVSGITLLNGWPLRFPIGSVSTYPSNYGNHANEDGAHIEVAAKKGDQVIELGASHGLSDGDIITIYGGTDTSAAASLIGCEVRRIDEVVGTDHAKLNYPLSFDHDANDVVREAVGGGATAPPHYVHEIAEENDLDSVSWHVHMLPSDQDADKAFDRRYVGGKIGSATISASEGELVTFGWEGVNFLNMMHNQQNQTTVGQSYDLSGLGVADNSGESNASLYSGANVAANMPRFALMHTIDEDDIVTAKQNMNGANTGIGYPTTDPYYFSQGTIKMFDQEFARIENFSITVSNGLEPRYYIGRQGNRSRGPYEVLEGQREYAMTATLTLPDASLDANTVHGSALRTNATELFKQLLLEGDYGLVAGRTGFTATIKFERGTDDYIILDIPGSPVGTPGTPNVPTGKLNEQGLFITNAAHPITADGSAFGIDVNMIFRKLRIYIRDDEPYYP